MTLRSKLDSLRTRFAGGGPPRDRADGRDGVAGRIDDADWAAALASSPVFDHLDAAARERLRALAERFLAKCRVSAAADFEPEPELLARIAAEACLLVLFHGDEALRAYRHVHELILYPAGFLVDQHWTDEYGVAHEREAELAGEAWQDGPVILAADDVHAAAPGFDVVLHEFAHVLDAGNGVVNGFPVIADRALRSAWPTLFAEAYGRLERAIEDDAPAPLDDYAAEAPAEFFAVATETFFTAPAALADAWPDIHDALARYYGQNPREAPPAITGGRRRRGRNPRRDRHGSHVASPDG